MEHVSIIYHDFYLYAECFFSPLTPGCGSHPYKSLIKMPKRQRIVGKCRFTPSSTKLAGRSNKRFSSLCVRKAAKRHFHVSLVPFLILQPKAGEFGHIGTLWRAALWLTSIKQLCNS